MDLRLISFVPFVPNSSSCLRVLVAVKSVAEFPTTQNSKFKTQNCELFTSNNSRRGVKKRGQKTRIFANFCDFLPIFSPLNQKTCAFGAKICAFGAKI